MVIYLVMFSVTTLLIYIYEKFNSSSIRYIFASLAVLLLSLLAGARDVSVGTDVNIYIVPDFLKALRHSSFIDFYNDENNGMECLYMIIQWGASRIFDTPNSVMFFLSIINIAFVFGAISNIKKYGMGWLAWLMYCLLFFNQSLNMMRQSISVAIILYIFSDYKNITFRKVFALSVFSMGFHYSGLMGLVLFIVYKILKIKFNKYIKIVFAFTFLISPFIMEYFLNFGIFIGIIPMKYDLYNYLHIVYTAEWHTFIFRCLLLPFMLKIALRNRTIDSERNRFLLLLMCFDVLASLRNDYLMIRVCSYFSIFELVNSNIVLSSITNKNCSRIGMIYMFCFAMFLYWYFRIVVMNYHGTIPYSVGVIL